MSPTIMRCGDSSLLKYVDLTVSYISVITLGPRLAAPGKKYLFATKKPFGHEAASPAFFHQPVRLNDGTRRGRVLNGGDIGQPGLLPHRVDVNLLRPELVNDTDRFRKVGAVRTPRLVHLSRQLTIQRRIQSTQRGRRSYK